MHGVLSITRITAPLCMVLLALLAVQLLSLSVVLLVSQGGIPANLGITGIALTGDLCVMLSVSQGFQLLCA